MNRTRLTQTVFALALVFAGIAEAQSLRDLNRLRRGARIIDSMIPAKGYICVADTSFYGSFVAEARDESVARAEAQNKCIRAGVSWVYCSPTCKKKR